MSEIAIAPLEDSPPVRGALREILVEAVADGASVSFMHPLSPEDSDAFWSRSLASAARGERVVLGAFEGDELVGTVTLFLDFPPNQPHRAEVGKLMTRVSHRGRGVATALMRAAERLAVERGRTHLLLDTAADGGASAFYEKLGYRLAGIIPDFAFKPHGGLSPTRLYWKRAGGDPSPSIDAGGGRA